MLQRLLKRAGANLKISAVITRRCVEGLSPLQRHPFFLERTDIACWLPPAPINPCPGYKTYEVIVFHFENKIIQNDYSKTTEKKSHKAENGKEVGVVLLISVRDWERGTLRLWPNAKDILERDGIVYFESFSS